MMSSWTFRIGIVVYWFLYCMGPPSFDRCLADSNTEERDALSLSPAPAPGVSVRKMVSSTLHWEQREYPASEGIQVLMRVVTDAHTDLNKRVKALELLGTFGPWLHKTDHIPQLIALYDSFTDREERIRLIGCLAASDDERALPLLTRFLSEAKDDLARFVAAYALAHWNIRRGVSELINLLESPGLGSEGQGFANTVLKVFQGLNREKGWGLLDEEILRRIEKRPNLNRDQKIALYIAEIKKWFAENEHRFPDWKPGDPLPEGPGEAPKPKDSE